MFLIFGIQELKRRSKDRPELQGGCPNCRGTNLTPITYRRWFTLFFIPVIPIGSAKSFYECNQCKQLFDENIAYHNTQPQQKEEIVINDNSLTFSRALISSMTYLAITNGYISSREEKQIQDSIAEFSSFTEELKSIKASIVSHGNKENQVFEYLYDTKDVLSKEEIKRLLTQIAGILDTHRISKEQETILKDFLIASGLPKEIYTEIVTSI